MERFFLEKIPRGGGFTWKGVTMEGISIEGIPRGGVQPVHQEGGSLWKGFTMEPHVGRLSTKAIMTDTRRI